MYPLKTFTLYRSSAGSGKTRTLAKEYLKLALQNKAYYFRHILAVTFANKATQEMKDRILGYLNDFAHGRGDALSAELKQELNQDEPTFRQNCTELRSEILHHYDQFSISTIDAFFQKVIRSFTRESGLIGDYRLEVEQEAVLEEVINNLMDELTDKSELTRWVVEFAKDNFENDRAWDVRSSLMDFAKEIFREEFKNIEDQVRRDTADPDFFKNLKSALWKIKNDFLESVSKPAAEILQTIKSKGWEDSDFSYGANSGIRGFFNQFAYNKSLSSYAEPKGRMLNYFIHAKNWAGKKTQHSADIYQTAEQRFIPHLYLILDTYDRHFQKALSAEVALKNLYVFGLLSDIARKLQEYKNENNLMLLADAPKFLNSIIQDSDTPFIYEKIGTFYRNYLIDEFQDTSGFQWKNFLPLLTNGLDQGYPSLVVGDVKQAIYRWRGGDLNLLQAEVAQKIGSDRVEIRELTSNFRSARNIVEFNNAFFETASTLVAAETGSALSTSAYHDVEQETSKSREGFVRVYFIQEQEDISWKEEALHQIPRHLEMLQRKGASLSEIAILVRKNHEGQDIAAHLLQYKNSENAMADCKYDVVSNESLRIDGATSVNLLLSAMRYLLNGEDPIARAQLSYEYAKLHDPSRSLADVFAITHHAFFEGPLPEAFKKEKISLKKLPLFELTETLIEIFSLGKVSGELSYLQAFQDLVLEFYSRERNDLASFLKWWEENKKKDKTSIKVSGEVDAVKILTIHKAKGLQFKYVLIPFCSWPIDHVSQQEPNLWVSSDQPPFVKAGYFPVTYGKALERTYFKAQYEEELTRAYLDNLNLLYVALTRAEDGMILMAPYTINNGSVSQWMLQCILQNDSLKNAWDESSLQLALGEELVFVSAEKKEAVNAVPLKTYFSSRWRDKLVIRQAGASYFEETQSEKRRRINYGIHLHAVLSRINKAAEIPAMLEQLVMEGLIMEPEKPEMQHQLDKLMAHPVVGPWFSTDWKVRTEVPILLPGGDENRIDRLMTHDHRAIVVDFKTGEKSKTDQKQVMEYMQVLRKMNFTEVDGYLLYTRDQEVMAVGEGKIKLIKKRDESQLGLF